VLNPPKKGPSLHEFCVSPLDPSFFASWLDRIGTHRFFSIFYFEFPFSFPFLLIGVSKLDSVQFNSKWLENKWVEYELIFFDLSWVESGMNRPNPFKLYYFKLFLWFNTNKNIAYVLIKINYIIINGGLISVLIVSSPKYIPKTTDYKGQMHCRKSVKNVQRKDK
jgi:hypothetical protein